MDISKPTTTVTTLKRRKTSRFNSVPAFDKIKLERVIGLTVNSNAALSCDAENGVVAYPAGCTVVLYSSKKNRQSHIINLSKKLITCLTFSSDGRYLATGESGHQPCVRIWDAYNDQNQIAELYDHKFAIISVAFSPNSTYIVSVGNQHDMVVNVWNWKANTKAASNKVSCKVNAISFSENGSYFVTAGVRHVKFWYMERSKTSSYQDTIPLQGRSAILADQRNNNFCGVVCGRGATASSTFCITQSGLLCEFNSRRILEKWVQLKVKSATSVVLGGEMIFVGCFDGVVRVFKATSLTFVATLPYPHSLGVDVSAATVLSPIGFSQESSNNKYPDTVALCYDEKHSMLTCVYADHSLYQWNVADFRKVGKVASFLVHSGAVWSIEVLPPDLNHLPPDTFITCSNDDTIRFWNFSSFADTSNYQRNIYSQELLKVLYADPELQSLCNPEIISSDKSDCERRNGVRVLRISADGKHLASGDRRGNLRIFRLSDCSLIREIEAHDSEVLTLEYTNQNANLQLLASGSRDRMLHVLSVDDGYEPLCSLDDHSAAIVAVRFINGSANSNDLFLLSCGCDKLIIFHRLMTEPEVQFVRISCIASQMNVYDMDVDLYGREIYTACQDRQIRIYDIQDGKLKKSYKASIGDDGTLIKINLDNSSNFVATSSSDKNLGVFNAKSGECAAAAFGHGEIVTGLKFTADFRRLITVSVDSCIFVWRLSTDITTKLSATIANQEMFVRQHSSASTADDAVSTTTDDDAASSVDDVIDKSNIPAYARRCLGENVVDTPEDSRLYKPRGRWAQGAPSAPIFDRGEHFQQAASSSGLIKQLFASDSQQRLEEQSLRSTITRREKETSNFGSLANVRLNGDDENSNEPANSSATIFYAADPASNLFQEKHFEVKERNLDGSRALLYCRTDTLGNDISDEDENSLTKQHSMASICSTTFTQDAKDLSASVKSKTEDTFDELGFSTPAESFQRNSSGRLSITSKYLQKTRQIDENSPLNNNISVIHTPTIEKERVTEISKVQTQRAKWNQVTAPPSLKLFPDTPSQVQSSEPDNGHVTWSYKPKSAATATATPGTSTTAAVAATPALKVDPKNVYRAKALSSMAKCRERRQSMPDYSFDDESARNGDKCLLSPRDAVSVAGRFTSHRDSRTSLISSASAMTTSKSLIENRRFTTTTKNNNKSCFNGDETPRISNSLSMSSLAYSGHDSDSSETVKKISDMREKLRKSQENLARMAVTVGESHKTTPSAASQSVAGRSKSYGNILKEQRFADKPESDKNTENRGSLASALQRARELTRSVSSLRAEGTTVAAAPSSCGPQSALSDSLMNVLTPSKNKSACNFPPSQSNEIDDEDLNGSAEQSGSFYTAATTTLPRYRKVPTGVQKKVVQARARHLLVNSVSTLDNIGNQRNDTVPSIKPHYLNVVPPPVPMARSVSALISKHPSTEPRRNPSACLEFGASLASANSDRTTRDEANTGAAVSGNVPVASSRRSSYLARLLAADDRQQAGDKASSTQGHSLEAEVGSEFFDGAHFEKMSSHCRDTLIEFRTTLDKVLQSYQMVQSDNELTESERSSLKITLSSDLAEAQRRLNQALSQNQSPTFERHDPEGGGDHNSSVIGMIPNFDSLPIDLSDTSTSAFLQQCSDAFVAMIQQKIAAGKK